MIPFEAGNREASLVAKRTHDEALGEALALLVHLDHDFRAPHGLGGNVFDLFHECTVALMKCRFPLDSRETRAIIRMKRFFFPYRGAPYDECYRVVRLTLRALQPWYHRVRLNPA